MSASPFDSLDNVSTLSGVLVGAVVATLGSFAASWYERRLFRRERESDAALVFGELLRTLALQIAVLRTAHSRGDPFGPVTIRMARSVRREVEIYDRNRERLFMIRDELLRPQASALMARMAFALDRVFDATDDLATRTSEAEREEVMLGRAQAFDFLLACADELPPMVRRFAALANTRLTDLDLELAGFGAAAIRNTD